jgi:hypothetical protein
VGLQIPWYSGVGWCAPRFVSSWVLILRHLLRKDTHNSLLVTTHHSGRSLPATTVVSAQRGLHSPIKLPRYRSSHASSTPHRVKVFAEHSPAAHHTPAKRSSALSAIRFHCLPIERETALPYHPSVQLQCAATFTSSIRHTTGWLQQNLPTIPSGRASTRSPPAIANKHRCNSTPSHSLHGLHAKLQSL